jgi:hypothetical protein
MRDDCLRHLSRLLNCPATEAAVVAGVERSLREKVVVTTIGDLREAVRSEVLEVFENQWVSDQEVADSLRIDKSTWRSWYQDEPALCEAAGTYAAKPGKRGAWQWRLGAVRRWLREAQKQRRGW